MSLVSRVPPLDLLYAREKVRHLAQGYLLDANNLKLQPRDHVKTIRDVNPGMLFLSFDICALGPALDILEMIKNDDTVICVLGMFPTTSPEFILESGCVDFVIRGEPERRIEYLVDAFTRLHDQHGDAKSLRYALKRDIAKALWKKTIDGISFSDKGKTTISQPMMMIEDLDTLPIPKRKDQRDKRFGSYRYENPFAKDITVMRIHRGCPHSCSYCDAKNIYGKRLRRRSVENVMEEIKSCILEGIRSIAFIDHTFTEDREWTLRFCKEMRERNLHRKLTWIAMTRIDCIDRPLMENMRKAGCIMVGLGIERSTMSGITNIRKGIAIREVKKRLTEAREAGILTMGYFIIGFPDETENGLLRLKRFIMDLPLDFIQVSYATPLPGTSFFRECSDWDLIKENDLREYRFLQRSVLTTRLGQERLHAIRKDIFRTFYFSPAKGIGRVWRIIRHPGISKVHVCRYAMRLAMQSFS